MLSSISLFLRFDFFVFQFMQTLIDLLLLGGLMLYSESVLLFSSEFNFLEIFQCIRQLSQLLSLLTVLLCQLFNLFLQKVHVIYRCSVAHVDVEDGLDSMVLFVQEIDLILQFLHILLICLLLVLLSNLVHVLAALVKFTQS